jgi:hypothetical protein
VKQQPLAFDAPAGLPDIPAAPRFQGPGYVKALDQKRLSRHCEQVLAALRRQGESWITYEELALFSDVPPGSVRTRVSNLRAWGHVIDVRTRPDRFREVRLHDRDLVLTDDAQEA